ncbi:MAG: succinate dehydrogenase / fumarate reductase cytochrome b subunit [Lentimonas sp.]|jgi:succinate dehydrogenase / fumarate reductase cytochrome b subunit
MCALCDFLKSTIGRKILMALTGLVLILFVLGHMLGNLQVFLGPDSINAYAYKLHHVMPAALLWAIRLFLIICISIHIWAAITLTLDNRKARPEGYSIKKSVQATYAAKTMRMSGIILFAFIVFHIAHYTARVIPGKEYNEQIADVALVKNGKPVMENGQPVMTFNVYDMMIEGFQVWWVSAFYILATGLLCMHLAHGFSSMFQTMGIRNKNWRQFLDRTALAYGLIIFLGFAITPVAVLTGILKETNEIPGFEAVETTNIDSSH